MTLGDYFDLQKAVLAAMVRLKREIETADQDEVIELANRLRKAVDNLQRADYKTDRSLLTETNRIIGEARRVLFAPGELQQHTTKPPNSTENCS
jgi:hypothetical protein